jgi:polyisoprenoid-binding protein YceI
MLARERWEIDGSRSTLTFALRHFVVGEIKGTFGRWGGVLLLDPAHLGRSSLEVWFELSSVDTGDPERDAHLRSPELLDAARFPRAELRSTGIALRGDGDAIVSGRLDLHGVTRDVELAIVAEGHAHYRASAKIDRQEFGLHWNQDLDVGGIVVGDNVEIAAHVEMVRTPDTVSARQHDPGLASAP